MRPANNFQKLHLALSKILVRTAALEELCFTTSQSPQKISAIVKLIILNCLQNV